MKIKKSYWLGIIALVAVIFLLFGFNNKDEKVTEEEIALLTEDNINLKGSFYSQKSGKAVILIHMLNSDRRSYDDFALLLNKNYGVLSFDSRGHGGSDLNWNDFSENDFNNMVLDVKAAKDFLLEKGFSDIYLVGASIGANTALNYAVTDNSIGKIVLLSPGLDYRGVSIKDSIKNYGAEVLIVVSEEDEYSFSSSEMLFEESIGEKEIVRLSNAGHGTIMFGGTNLMSDVFDWLNGIGAS